MGILEKLAKGRFSPAKLGAAKDEFETLLELSARRRPPRLVFVGEDASSLADLREGLFGVSELEEAAGEGPYRGKRVRGDRVEILELELGTGAATEFRVALDHAPADAVVMIVRASEVARTEATALALLDALDEGEEAPPILALVVDDERERALEARRALRDAAHGVGYHLLRVFIQTGARPGFAESSLAALSDALIEETSLRVRLALCRALPHGKKAREALSNRLVDAFAAVTMAVAITPIPFADAAVITPLQALMVSLIGYISGRAMDRKTLGEALASLGVVGAAGFGLRFAARQAVKFVPGAGSAAASLIASSGTKALGKAATLYFLRQPKPGGAPPPRLASAS